MCRSEADARGLPHRPELLDTSDANALSRKTIDRSPRHATDHYNLGLALQSKGRLEEAIEEYRKALETTDDVAEVHNNLAAALASIRELPEAIEHFRRVTQLKPEYAEGHFNLG